MSRRQTGIDRRELLKVLGGAVVASTTACRPLRRCDAGDIVIIVLDALRAESLPVYGCSRSTAPFISELATSSLLFERCYAAGSWTKPAVTSLLTGLLPAEHGDNRVDTALPDVPSLPRRLSELGYTTALFTANLILAGEYGAEQHFDQVVSVQPDRMNGYHLLDELRGWLGKVGSRRPLFVYLHFFPPHSPYDPPPEYLQQAHEQAALHPPSAAYLRDCHRVVKMSTAVGGERCRLPIFATRTDASTDPLHHLVRYEANVMFADVLLAEAVRLWQELRGDRERLLVVTSDHGECVGEHGLFAGHGRIVADQLLHVPLLINGSGVPAGVREPVPVSHLDLAPTLLARLLHRGAEPNLGGPGRALLLDPQARRRQRIIVSQFVSNEHGVPADAELSWALTEGANRLVYNDACGLGTGNVREVLSGLPASAAARRGPLELPGTCLQRPLMLDPQVELTSFALHAICLQYGEVVSLSGRLALPAGSSGSFLLRARRPGEAPRTLLELTPQSPEHRFEASLPAFSRRQPERDEVVICEARWLPHGGDRRGEWLHILSCPLHQPVQAAGLELLAVEPVPAVVCAGDSLRIELRWRCLARHDEWPQLTVRLETRQGRVLCEERRGLLTGLQAADEVPHLFLFAGFELDERVELRVPADAEPGTCRLRVGWTGKESLSETASLTIVESPLAAVAELSDQERARHHLTAIGSSIFEHLWQEQGSASFAAGLRRRLPGEGHPFYLQALRARPDERRHLLRRCLQATPQHLAALRLIADDDDRSSVLLDRLTPQYPLDLVLGSVLRLYGFDLLAAPEPVEGSAYLRCYWQALAPIAQALGADLQTPAGTIFWFLGSGNRPTSEWQVGEAVVETVAIRLATSGGALDGPALLQRAELVTTAWPGKPEWRRIEARDEHLYLAARIASDPDPTRIELRLPSAGAYRLSGRLELRSECPWPTRLQVTIARHGEATLGTVIHPGKPQPLDLMIEAREPGEQLCISYVMTDEAPSGDYSNLLIRRFRLEGPGFELTPLRIGVYPYWQHLHSGMQERPFLSSSSGGDGMVELGSFRWQDLPRAEEDLRGRQRRRPASSALFDLSRDRWEEHDLSAEESETAARLRARLLELQSRQHPAETAPRRELSEERKRQLRAIGYVD